MHVQAFSAPDEEIKKRIYSIRGQKVMLDGDLAALYGVSTSYLNKSVKRNIQRFPEDFMFRLDNQEFENLIFQFGISSCGSRKPAWGGRRTLPFVFTEQGIAMLSSVLHSEIAIEVNIRIIRIFTFMRKVAVKSSLVLEKLQSLEDKLGKHGEDIQGIFIVLKQMLSPEIESEPNDNQIGFKLSS